MSRQLARQVIIAAMEREVASLVEGAEVRQLEIPQLGIKAKTWMLFDAAVVAAGTGWERAFAVTKVAIETFEPELVTSIGYSGSHSKSLPVGALFVPAQVLGFKNRIDYRTGVGEGILFTAEGVTGSQQKAALNVSCAALAVDMEAAAVAEAAQAAGVRFLAVKAISDALEDRVDIVQPFVASEGFRTAAFVAHIAIRPWLWKDVAKLASNSRKASETLSEAVMALIRDPNAFLRSFGAPEVKSEDQAVKGGE